MDEKELILEPSRPLPEGSGELVESKPKEIKPKTKTNKAGEEVIVGGVAQMRTRFRTEIARCESNEGFRKIWKKLKTLTEHPNAQVALKAITLYLAYALGAPTQEIEAKVTAQMSPEERNHNIRMLIENKLGIVCNEVVINQPEKA